MHKIFVSSVFVGFETIRDEVISQLRKVYQAVHMEVFGARPDIPLEVCLKELRQSDIAVVIIGPHYGSRIRELDTSYTHEEFREAKRRGIPVLAFVVNWAPDLSEEDKKRLDGFLEEAKSAVLFEKSSEQKLVSDILTSLHKAHLDGVFGRKYRFFRSFDKFFEMQLKLIREKPPLFNHRYSLVGRESEMASLVEFVDGDTPAIIVSGAGGTGKSRLLLELAQLVSSRKASIPRILFCDGSAEWTTEDIQSLPAAPTVIAIDDAHRRDDLERLITACRGQNEEVRFILSCRPGAVDVALLGVANLFEEGSKPKEIKLAPLPQAQSLELAQLCLGPKFRHLSEQLFRVASDNPLVICIGGRCVATNAISPDVLSNAPEEFRLTVLDKLLQDPALEGEGAEDKREILELVAAVGPINIESASSQKALADFLELPPHELARHLAALEKAGFLQRRGRLQRIVPDVLSDHLLYRVAVDATGKPTGYVDEVFHALAPIFLSNIIANAAELDWRAVQTSTHQPVLNAVWSKILSELPLLSFEQRAVLLESLRRAAAFQPDRVLEIIEWMCDNREAPPDPGFIGQLGLDDSPDRMDHKACDLLSFIAGHPDFISRCLIRIWDLAEKDDRLPHRYPDHPRRRLADLTGYNAPDVIRTTTLAFVMEKLKAEESRQAFPWAIEIIGTVLKREVERHVFTKRKFKISSGSLAPYLPQIEGARNKALECLGAMAKSSRIDEAVQAVNELANLLRKPFGYFGRSVPPSEIAAWLPESKKAVDVLADIAVSCPSIVIRYLARKKLREIGREFWTDLESHIDAVLQKIPGVPHEQMFDICSGTPREEQLDDREQQAELLQRQCAETAEKLWQVHRTASGVGSALIAACTDLNRVSTLRTDNTWYLIQAIAKAQPAEACNLIDVFLAQGSDVSLGFLPSTLVALGNMGERNFVSDFLKRATVSPNEKVRKTVARALRSLFIDQGNSEQNLDLVKPLLNDASEDVRCAAIESLRTFKNSAPIQALQALVDSDWRASEVVAAAACDIMHPQYGLNPDQLTEDQIGKLLSYIEELPSLDSQHHDVLDFLEYASTRRPRQVVLTLLRRIQKVDERREERWDGIYRTPIPYPGPGFSISGIKDSAERLDLLCLIRDASLSASAIKRHWIAELFATASQNTATDCVVLKEWIVSNDKEKVTAAAGLLRGFDREILFSECLLVADLLDAAAALGTECHQHVAGELQALSIGGSYSSTPGEPAPRHLKDMATCASMIERFKDRPHVRNFYEVLHRNAKAHIERARHEFEEDDDE